MIAATRARETGLSVHDSPPSTPSGTEGSETRLEPRDPASTGSLESLLEYCFQKDGHWHAEYHDLILTSAFQPVFGVAHQRTVGYEALIRARTPDGLPIPPPELFELPRTLAERVELDRLCRLLHVANFTTLKEPYPSWMLVNVDPQVVTNGPGFGSFFGELLSFFDLAPARIVVEILESHIPDEEGLASTVAYYREAGCLVAIDDFGAGHSNLDRIVRLQPDLVKLDRALVRQASQNPVAGRMFPGLVSMLHEAGCLVVAEGVEQPPEAQLAFDSNIDFIQGFRFARPGAFPHQRGAKELAEDVESSRHQRGERARQTHQALAPFLYQFQQAATSRRAGVELEVAAFRLLNMERVVRCYELDAHGRQFGPNILPARETAAGDPRFEPLNETKGAVWHQSTYYHAAISTPDRLQISRPYLSLTGAHLCVTLSMAIEIDGETLVVCCDIDWSDED